MDQLTRIEKLLERIAVALETFTSKQDLQSLTHGGTIAHPKDMLWKTADTRYGDIDRFHSGGIGGGLREGETPTILSRGDSADGRWYGPCEPPKPEDFTILDKGEDVLSKEDAPKGTEHIRQRFGVDYSVMGDGDG